MTIKQLENLAAKFTWQKIREAEVHSALEQSTFYSAVRWNCRYLEPLLKSWAQHVKAYLADLCYEMMGITDAAQSLDMSPDTQWRVEYPLRIIGIRQNGVDHPEYVECRMGDVRKGVYSAVFKVTIEKDTCSGGAVFKMRLYRAKL